MVFSSVEEAVAYIQMCISASMPECAEEIKRIMDEVTQGQVTGWSGDIFSSVIPKSSGNSAEAGFEDTGGWFSLITGEAVGNPIKFLEAGTTWNRGASNIMAESEGRAETEVTELLIQLLRGMGIPVE